MPASRSTTTWLPVAGRSTKVRPEHRLAELRQILEDRACVRYPCEVVFDAGPLEPGEFAHPVAKGERPEDGLRCASIRFS